MSLHISNSCMTNGVSLSISEHCPGISALSLLSVKDRLFLFCCESTDPKGFSASAWIWPGCRLCLIHVPGARFHGALVQVPVLCAAEELQRVLLHVATSARSHAQLAAAPPSPRCDSKQGLQSLALGESRADWREAWSSSQHQDAAGIRCCSAGKQMWTWLWLQHSWDVHIRVMGKLDPNADPNATSHS